MKNIFLIAASVFTAQAFAGILPELKKTDNSVPAQQDDQTTQYQSQLDDWNAFLENLDVGGAVNLNIYSEYHRKSKKFPGATLGVDMEINEIAIFYMEENLGSSYHWTVKNPKPTPATEGNPGPFDDGKDYISHVFEIISSEYRPKPVLPGTQPAGGIRILAIRGRKPNEIELPDRVKDKLRREATN